MIERAALVTGANRGIGLEVARQLARGGLRVVLGSRVEGRGEEAAGRLAAEGLSVRPVRLDVADPASITEAARELRASGVAVDILVNNAGIYPGDKLLEMGVETLETALAVHLLGPFHACRAFVPGMIARGYGRIVNVSSGYGSFGEGLEGPPAYSLSKAALNALTVKLAQEVPESVKVNAVCPGWVRTRMGGSRARRSVETGAETVVWLATLPAEGPSGGFFRDRRRIPW
jgi:NAD(P)-dependent dehydrogenase (short-subunit alcohol dehydrogenase family)